MNESTKASLLVDPAVVERAHPPVSPQLHGPFGHRRDEMRELNRLRCRLRAVNIEYSALVRCKVGEAAYARMRELRTERRMLMALIAVVRYAAEMDRAFEFALSGPVRSALHRELALPPRPGLPSA